VVVTLIYLANQIRSQNRESRIVSVHGLSVEFRGAIHFDGITCLLRLEYSFATDT
jgi:hypothetical protein